MHQHAYSEMILRIRTQVSRCMNDANSMYVYNIFILTLSVLRWWSCCWIKEPTWVPMIRERDSLSTGQRTWVSCYLHWETLQSAVATSTIRLINEWHVPIDSWRIYSGAKMYLVSHQLCKFSHLKRWEACNFPHMYTSTMTVTVREWGPKSELT